MVVLEKTIENVTEEKKTQAEKNMDEVLQRYYKTLEKHFEGTSPKQEARVLFNRFRQIDDEVRLLKNSIHFFENVALVDQQRMPELKQFKRRLKEAIRIREALQLAIQTCP